MNLSKREPKDVDGQFVGTTGILGLAAYLFFFTILSSTALFLLWPGMSAQGWLALSDEGRYVAIVIAAGVLGSAVHASTTLADYVGNRRVAKSWVLWYISRVFIGGALALIFYITIRAGFFSTAASVGDINLFGVAALAGLVGMFSKGVSDKLSLVFGNIYGEAAPFKNQLEDLTSALGVATLDNYDGFICLSFEKEGGDRITFTEASMLTLKAGELYNLFIWFQPTKAFEGVAEKIEISGGIDSRSTEFIVAPTSDSFSITPAREQIKVDVTQKSARKNFTMVVPKKQDPYEIWVDVFQKNRLVHVASLTFLATSGEGEVSAGEGPDEPVLT